MRLATWTSLACAAALSAQTSPFRFVPKDAQLVVQFEAPGRLAATLAGTNVARLFASKELRELYAPIWAKAREQAPAWCALADELRRSQARITVGLRFRIVPPDLFAVAVLESAEEALLARIAALAPAGAPLVVRDHELAAVDLGDGFQVTLPDATAGVHVVFAGNNLKPRISGALRAGDGRGWQPPADFAGSACCAWQDFELVRQALIAAVVLPNVQGPRAAGAPRPASRPANPYLWAQELLGHVGVDGVRSARLRIGAHGTLVASDFTLEFTQPPQGLLACFDPAAARGLPAVLDLVPRTTALFDAGWFDVQEAAAALRRVADHVAPLSGRDAAALADGFQRATGTKLQDWTDCVGDEWARITEFAVIGEQPLPRVLEATRHLWDGECLVLELRDAAALARLAERAVRTRGLEQQRTTVAHAGFDVHRLPLNEELALEYAVTPSALVAVIGTGPSQALRAVLDEAKARAAGTAAAPWPAAVARDPQALPFQPKSLAVLDLVRAFTDIVATGQEDVDLPTTAAARAAMLEDADLDPLERFALALAGTHEDLARLLQQHGVRSLTTHGGSAAERWLWRLLW